MKNKSNQCGGIFNSGKCVLEKGEGEKLGLNIKCKRVICIGGSDKYGQCDLILKKRD